MKMLISYIPDHEKRYIETMPISNNHNWKHHHRCSRYSNHCVVADFCLTLKGCVTLLCERAIVRYKSISA